MFDFIATLLKFEKSECAFEQWANISHTPQKHSTLQNSTAASCPKCPAAKDGRANYPRRPTAAGALLLVSGVIVGDEEEDDDNDDD